MGASLRDAVLLVKNPRGCICEGGFEDELINIERR